MGYLWNTSCLLQPHSLVSVTAGCHLFTVITVPNPVNQHYNFLTNETLFLLCWAVFPQAGLSQRSVFPHAGTEALFCVPADSSGPSSTVSSAGPSSPTTADTSPRFSFSDKTSLTPQSSEETHSSQNTSSQPAPASSSQVLDPTLPVAEVPLTPNNSPEEDTEHCTITGHQPDNPECSQEEPEVTSAAANADLAAAGDPGLRSPCSALTELTLGRMEAYCLPGSLPVLLELRESSSEAGSSSQTPQSPEGPDEFFDTQESMELWMDSPESYPCPETPLEVGSTHRTEQ